MSTRNQMDTHILAGGSKRRTTVPVAHRQPSDQGGAQADERGGEQNEIPPPLMQDSIEDDDDTETVDVTRALRATNIVGSLFDLYDVDYGEVLPLPYASEICLQMAIDKAYGAATRPQDAPDTVSEALRSPDRTKWEQSMNTEMDAHIANGTWELVQLPKGRKVIGSLS